MKGLKRLRKRCDLTQEQLAKRLDVSQSSVAMWETGKTRPRGDRLAKLALVLDCSFEELIKSLY